MEDLKLLWNCELDKFDLYLSVKIPVTYAPIVAEIFPENLYGLLLIMFYVDGGVKK